MGGGSNHPMALPEKGCSVDGKNEEGEEGYKLGLLTKQGWDAEKAIIEGKPVSWTSGMGQSPVLSIGS